MTRLMDDDRAAPLVDLDLVFQLSGRNQSAANQAMSPRATPHDRRKPAKWKQAGGKGRPDLLPQSLVVVLAIWQVVSRVGASEGGAGCRGSQLPV